MNTKQLAHIIADARVKSFMPGFDRPTAAVENALKRVADGIADDAERTQEPKFLRSLFLKSCGFPNGAK